ncbi:MAG: EPS-associated MarR family transcriptional regulator [Lentisphaeria bacterium]|jgi:EPS-associated MarR family transcriptional regulator
MTESALNDELRYLLLKELEQNPTMSQRELAKTVGISLGKTNYCLKALIAAGWVKAGNFAKSENKAGYAYLLTPKGFSEKADVTLRFLTKKQRQYDQLKRDIAELQNEVSSSKNETVCETTDESLG